MSSANNAATKPSMKAIYKYEIPPPVRTKKNITSVTMPKGAEILTVALQHNKIVAWALVDANSVDDTEFKFQAFITGECIPEPEGYTRKYITTVFLVDGRYTVHIFLCV